MTGDEAVEVGRVRHDVVRDDDVRAAPVVAQAPSERRAEELAKSRYAGRLRGRCLLGRRVDAEHRDAVLDEVAQQVPVVATRPRPRDWSRRAIELSISRSACSRECRIKPSEKDEK